MITANPHNKNIITNTQIANNNTKYNTEHNATIKKTKRKKINDNRKI